MTDGDYRVLMVQRIRDDVNCPRCTSGAIASRRRLSPTQTRVELEKVYRGWSCGCRKAPESRIAVHVQGPGLEYLKLCAGCASEITGIAKDDLVSEGMRELEPSEPRR